MFTEEMENLLGFGVLQESLFTLHISKTVNDSTGYLHPKVMPRIFYVSLDVHAQSLRPA